MAYGKEGANRGAGTPADRKPGGKNTGNFDFSGQEARDDSPQGETPESEAREGQGGAKINFKRQHNEHNGAGRGTKLIPSHSHELHGGRRTTDREGGEP